MPVALRPIAPGSCPRSISLAVQPSNRSTAASGGRPPCSMCHVSLCTPYTAAAVAHPKADSGSLAMRVYRSRTFSLCCSLFISGAWLASVNGRSRLQGPWSCALPAGCGCYPPARPAAQALLPHVAALPCLG
jgi:hypothetical protein